MSNLRLDAFPNRIFKDQPWQGSGGCVYGWHSIGDLGDPPNDEASVPMFALEMEDVCSDPDARALFEAMSRKELPFTSFDLVSEGGEEFAVARYDPDDPAPSA